ncbi:MAG TPA: radical SAM protein [Terriglobales bacterium]|nr:radical SAM protein [Terriglobales bacterium]
MPSQQSRSSLTAKDVLYAWGKILGGNAPMLSIEITRECPLHCPGCYAYGDEHLGGGKTLRELSDFRGDALVNGVLALVQKHQPLHVSLVGGEPLIRHRELSRILPALSQQGRFALVVTSAVIPIPAEWMKLPHVRVAVSVDGLPEHHDVRRHPATYQRILENIAGRKINVHWTITRPMMQRDGYLEEFVAFWSARPEVDHIWVSLYSPQVGEQSAEKLTQADREKIARELPEVQRRHPKFLMGTGMALALLSPPAHPGKCVFSRMSTNYSADLRSRVEPCVFGGNPDCSQCGCMATTAVRFVEEYKLFGPLKAGHLVNASVAIGSAVNRLRENAIMPARWRPRARQLPPTEELVQIEQGSGD